MPLSTNSRLLTKCSASEKIGTDHLKAITARLVRPQHQRSRFKSLLDDRYLTLIELEVDDFPGLGIPARKMSLDFILESFLAHLFCFVQPGCTVKVFSFPARHFDHLYCLAPTHLSELLLGDSCQFLVNRHQVIGLAT